MVGTQEVRTSKKCGEVGQAGDCMQASQDAVMALLDCNIEMMMTAAAAGAVAEAAGGGGGGGGGGEEEEELADATRRCPS